MADNTDWTGGLDGGEPPFETHHGSFIPKRATNRPHRHLPRPRRRGPKEQPDAAAQERIEWLEWVRDQIIADTLAAGKAEEDHWKDKRWDEPPPAWSFERWKAARRRADPIA